MRVYRDLGDTAQNIPGDALNCKYLNGVYMDFSADAVRASEVQPKK